MISSAPKPVLDFLVRYLVNPDEEALHRFCTNLLGLELARAYQSMALDSPPFELSDIYQSNIDLAARILERASDERRFGNEQVDLAWHWLTLLGHRIAAERGLSVGGIAALATVASMRLDLSLEDPETWYADTLFEQYTRTVLRDEWDYTGLMPRRLDRVLPVEDM